MIRNVCVFNKDIIQNIVRKQKKFETKIYFHFYPPNLISPRLYGVIKAHKPEKCYAMGTIVSTIGTPSYEFLNIW